jgi:hypothetical protein
MHQSYYPRRSFIPLSLKALFWLAVLLVVGYILYYHLSYPRLIVEVLRTGHVIWLWVIHP